MTDLKLADCPFCGAGEAEGPELRVDEKGCHFVFCFGCGATGPQHAFMQTEAIPSWNRRATPPLLQKEEGDGKDAARLDWLERWHDIPGKEPGYGETGIDTITRCSDGFILDSEFGGGIHDTLRAAIDAAIATRQGEKPSA